MKLNKTTLYQKCDPFTDNNTELRLELAEELVRTMRANGGMGLAANQVGMRKRLFVMEHGSKIRHCFNPKILEASELLIMMAEGCLSFPEQRLNIVRPSKIKVEYSDAFGNIVVEELDGKEARCFQHELDHLDGITMFKRTNN